MFNLDNVVNNILLLDAARRKGNCWWFRVWAKNVCFSEKSQGSSEVKAPCHAVELDQSGKLPLNPPTSVFTVNIGTRKHHFAGRFVDSDVNLCFSSLSCFVWRHICCSVPPLWLKPAGLCGISTQLLFLLPKKKCAPRRSESCTRLSGVTPPCSRSALRGICSFTLSFVNHLRLDACVSSCWLRFLWKSKQLETQMYRFWTASGGLDRNSTARTSLVDLQVRQNFVFLVIS